MIEPITVALAIAGIALVVAIFNFCISLFVARTLGQRMQREVYFGIINKKYCDIRQLSSIKGQRPLPSPMIPPFSRCIKDANDVFLESLRFPDVHHLKQADAALDAILNDMLALLKKFNIPHGLAVHGASAAVN